MGTVEQELLDGCFSRAQPEEPVFVLRGQDVFAPILIGLWISLAEAFGTCPAAKLEEARMCMIAMRKWPKRKVPD